MKTKFDHLSETELFDAVLFEIIGHVRYGVELLDADEDWQLLFSDGLRCLIAMRYVEARIVRIDKSKTQPTQRQLDIIKRTQRYLKYIE